MDNTGNNLAGVKNIYLIGIGGIGMSGLALLLKDKGFSVKGSDASSSYITDMLKREGIELCIGHSAANITPGIDLLGISSAIKEDNPEIIQAKKLRIPIIKRGELLGYICRDKKVVAVAGSHGKTTSSSLLGHIFNSLGIKPAVFVGGLPLNYSRNAWDGQEYFVMETDESDGSFLFYNPWVSIITNIDYEHLDYHGNMENLKESFLKFALATSNKVIGCSDDASVKNILSRVDGIGYGLQTKNQFHAENIIINETGSSFDMFAGKNFITAVKTSLVGEHNVLNVLGVLSFFFYIGEDIKKASEAVKYFKGTKRRFQFKNKIAGVTFMDDYAHHPTEIAAVLKAARRLLPRRLVVIFQPHRFSRVKALSKEFSRCFSDADEVIITDIYSASEKEIEGINSLALSDSIRQNFSGVLRYIPKEELAWKASLYLKEGDLVFGLGAGDINLLMEDVINEFKRDKIKT